MRRILLAAPMLVLFFVSLAFAPTDPIPHLINYQGMLTDDGGGPLNGSYDLTFSIYSVSSGGSALWDETHNDVLIEDGLFSVILGSTESIPSSVFEGAERYLGIKVETDPELAPRIRLTSVGYAYLAETAISDGDWTISGDDIHSAVSGNVGIGAAPPADKLDVAGTVKMSGFKMAPGASAGYVLTSDGSGVGNWEPAPGGEIDGSGTVNYIPKFSSSISIDNSVIYQSGSNIGVGTTSPNQKLYVNGTVASTRYFRAESSQGSNVTTILGDLFDSGVGGVGTLTSHDLGLFAGNQRRVTIEGATGDVGIRTASPDAVLDVYGTRNISASSDGIVNIGNSSGTHVTLDNNEIHGRNGSSTSDLYLNFYGGDVLIAQQGNVGIGTSSPDAKLEVYTTASEHGTHSYSFSHYHSGVYGESTRGYGVWGKHTDPSYTSTGVFGENTGSGAGVLGDAGTGTGVIARSASGNPLEAYDTSPSSNRRFYVSNAGNAYCDGSFSGGGADLAEMIAVSSGASAVEPGDVMVIDPNNPRAILKSSEPRSSLVAGIYSAKPGFIGSERNWDKPTGRSEEELGTYTLEDVASEFNEIPLAVVGIVLCKVSAENGSIGSGDLLVTSSTAGHAMRDSNPQVGTVLGKALESLASGTGVIKVLVTLH